MTAPTDFHFARKRATTLFGRQTGNGASGLIATAAGSAFEG
ncbi:hypothetical protein [Rhodopseudomonas palustris]